jgi:tRNA(fMet)-specific endonuclease VapC
MKFLLDTNVCIAIINGNPGVVRERVQKELRAGSEIQLSSIALFELWYGVSKSRDVSGNTRKLQSFLAGPVTVLAFDLEDAAAAGEIRADAERVGKPIGAYDILIAGQSLRRKCTLVTANVREFSRIPGLIWQDWAK